MSHRVRDRFTICTYTILASFFCCLLSDALQDLPSDTPVPPPIHQMLLILQGIHDRPVTENTMLLERLVAKVISPYLGMLGLYDGGTEPEVRSNYKIPSRLPSPVICKWAFYNYCN